MGHLSDVFVVSQLTETNIFKVHRLIQMVVLKMEESAVCKLRMQSLRSVSWLELVVNLVIQLAEAEDEQISRPTWMFVVGKYNSCL